MDTCISKIISVSMRVKYLKTVQQITLSLQYIHLINASSLCLGGWYMFDKEILKNIRDLQHFLIL